MLNTAKYVLFMILCAISFSLFANPSKNQQQIKHVILITLDGVRWQDLYQLRHNFPYVWTKYAKQLRFYGMPESDSVMEVASIPVSLPSYQSISSGAVQPCKGNDCQRVSVETFPEALIHQLKLKKKDVAIFTTWSVMKGAVESVPGTTFTSLGNERVTDPETNIPDAMMEELNHVQEFDSVGHGDRLDPYTVSQALHYFRSYQPTFLWLSLAVSDTAAHRGDVGLYGALLRYYDETFNRLMMLLDELGLADKTMVIVTTDHGRGNGLDWTSHGPQYPESKQTWAFVYNGSLKPVAIQNKIKHYSTLSIRPAVEAALGL